MEIDEAFNVLRDELVKRIKRAAGDIDTCSLVDYSEALYRLTQMKANVFHLGQIKKQLKEEIKNE